MNPSDAQPPDHALAPRPWPVVLLTALGAWLATLPLLLAVGLLLGESLIHGPGPYLVGTLALSGAIVVLRAHGVALFVEQLAVPALMVGLGTLGMGLYGSFGAQGAAWVMSAIVVGLAAAIPREWLRWLLGASGAGLLGFACLVDRGLVDSQASSFWVLHALLAVWWGMARWSFPRVGSMGWMAPLASGWLLACLVGLTWISGQTFLLGGAVGTSEALDVARWVLGRHESSAADLARHVLSTSLMGLAAAQAWQAWPAVRGILAVALSAVLIALAWWMPTLGAAVWVVVATGLWGRWRLAGASALVAVWIVGAFYYQLQWSLGEKAWLLIGAGAVLGAFAAWELRRSGKAPLAQGTAAASPTDRRHWLIAAGALATLLVANFAIWDKQNLIHHGQKVLMPLAPVDPRSLMQGDFMRLRFSALDDGRWPLLADLAGKRPHLVMQRDLQGVAHAVRLAQPEQVLNEGEFLLELTPKDGQWVIVTDAWFFREGQAERWAAARFGEFRVLPDGKALLVGLVDSDLKPISTAVNPPSSP